jgi:hypothetical protein
MSEEVKTFGADNTEVVWFAELTEAMVEYLSDDDLQDLCYQLDKAVAEICESFGVK